MADMQWPRYPLRSMRHGLPQHTLPQQGYGEMIANGLYPSQLGPAQRPLGSLHVHGRRYSTYTHVLAADGRRLRPSRPSRPSQLSSSHPPKAASVVSAEPICSRRPTGVRRPQPVLQRRTRYPRSPAGGSTQNLRVYNGKQMVGRQEGRRQRETMISFPKFKLIKMTRRT